MTMMNSDGCFLSNVNYKLGLHENDHFSDNDVFDLFNSLLRTYKKLLGTKCVPFAAWIVPTDDYLLDKLVWVIKYYKEGEVDHELAT